MWIDGKDGSGGALATGDSFGVVSTASTKLKS